MTTWPHNLESNEYQSYLHEFGFSLFLWRIGLWFVFCKMYTLNNGKTFQIKSWNYPELVTVCLLIVSYKMIRSMTLTLFITNLRILVQNFKMCSEFLCMLITSYVKRRNHFCGAEQHQHVALYVCRKNVRTCVCRKKISNVARRRQTSHDVARLLLMVPIEPWQNSTPIFGAAAFCTIKIEDFRASLTSTFSTTSSAYWWKRRSLRCTSSKRQLMEVAKVDQLKDTNNIRLSWAMPHSEQSNQIRLTKALINKKK